MAIRGPLDHIDLSVSDPDRSIPFYDALLRALGYARLRIDAPDFLGPRPRRAAWRMGYPGGSWFGIEVRPAEPGSRDKRHDRYAPGLHHLAFHAESRAAVDEVHEAVRGAGGRVLDPPADYTGQTGYSEGYYAVFFADPDSVKLEVAHIPASNP